MSVLSMSDAIDWFPIFERPEQLFQRACRQGTAGGGGQRRSVRPANRSGGSEVTAGGQCRAHQHVELEKASQQA